MRFAWYVAKGFSQEEGVNYENFFTHSKNVKELYLVFYSNKILYNQKRIIAFIPNMLTESVFTFWFWSMIF